MYRFFIQTIGIAALLISSPGSLADDDPYADAYISYDQGADPAPGYTDPLAALGEPARFNGPPFDSTIVSVFYSAWQTGDTVSIGQGGHLTVKFNTPVTDDTDNPFGIDLLIFGNAFFDDWDGQQTTGHCAIPAVIFNDGGVIEVSEDNVNWYEVAGVEADGLFPTEGYLDHEDPRATSPGDVPSDFTLPVNPALQLSDFDGLYYVEILELYRGSGGGVGVDLADVEPTSIKYVRISNPENPLDLTPEIDALVDVAPRKQGDVNKDGTVNIDDIFAILGYWGPARPNGWAAELTGDGQVDIDDIFAVLGYWE